MIIQFCGMSGSGKTTVANGVKSLLEKDGVRVEVIDGDVYRKAICPDLGFSKEDRNENIRRLAFIASKLSQYNVVAIICAINPYDDIRQEVARTYGNVSTVFVNCGLPTLIQRDTKGLYEKALLPDEHPNKIHNLTGVNDPFEEPQSPDLIINSDSENVNDSIEKLYQFVTATLL